MGGFEEALKWANKNKADFYLKVWTKLAPLQFTGQVKVDHEHAAMGGFEEALKWANKNKADFYLKVWTKLAPLQFTGHNNPEQRAALFRETGCGVIDDETAAVALFAQTRGIAFAGLRIISDGAEDNLPPAVISALDPRGGVDIGAVIRSIIADPDQIPALEKTANEAQLALAELATAAKSAGSYMQWNPTK